MATKKTDLKITVTLGNDGIPNNIQWESPDLNEPKDCKSMSLSFYDRLNRDTFKLDLWTKDFQIMEMDHFMFNTLKGLADSYYSATKNTELSNEMRKFVQYFGEKTKVINPK